MNLEVFRMEMNLVRTNGSDAITEGLQRYQPVVRFKLAEVMQERQLTQSDLHKLTGIRLATISEMANAKKLSINVAHLVALMSALRIQDVRELVDIQFNEEAISNWDQERKEYPIGLSPKQKEEMLEAFTNANQR